MMAAFVWNAIPAPWRLGLSIGLLLAIVSLMGGAYLYVDHRGYSRGYETADAECTAEKRLQEATNREAMRLAEKRLFEAAEKLSLRTVEIDDAVKTIDAAVAVDPDNGELCLSADSVRRLNAIK